MRFFTFCIFLSVIAITLNAQERQLPLSRVTLMPDMPTPYVMRDWKKVTKEYDALIFNTTATGTHWPLVKIKAEGINFPSISPILMDTYVGTKSSNQAEAINILPALVGASLVDIDKSNQSGVDWVVKANDFFNSKNGQNVYLNGYSTTSGGDWWYDLMPNVYFYQLYDRYPQTINFQNQFTTVADRWLAAVHAMGGSTTPWTVPNMNYRAFNLMTMQGNATGVKEPESAGSIAWLLYQAYTKTGQEKYLNGAELAMDFLNDYPSNPSYELQLPYGAIIAAKMNAKHNTNFDIQKLLNWCFDRGPLRGWGAIVGKWDGVDVSGLIGEANDNGNDYAFVMNGFQQAAALIPLMKYDKRFARDIAKWTLNMANASRLFYRPYVTNQDDFDWSLANDPNAVIAYEALKQKDEHNSNKPLNATGDAKRGQWADTNLSLYSSSSVGYLGAIIDTTNVAGILRLDLNITDFFESNPYPAYAFYNPHTEDKQVAITLPSGSKDVYDAIRESKVLTNVSGMQNITIKAGEVVILTYLPANSHLDIRNRFLFVNDVVVDYRYEYDFNTVFRIKSFSTTDTTVEVGAKVPLYFETEGGEIEAIDWYPGVVEEVNGAYFWTVPNQLGRVGLRLTVVSGRDHTDSIIFNVVEYLPKAPDIKSFEFEKQWQNPSTQATYSIVVEDDRDDVDALQIEWTASSGNIISQEGNTIVWQSPSASGVCVLTATVTDSDGLITSKELPILVRQDIPNETAPLFAYYPFNGNVLDQSGNGRNATASGVDLTSDARNIPESAYLFNAGSDLIKVPNSTAWNFRDAITLAFWVKVSSVPEETFILSHGSWEERWKVSITPDRKLRWTIKTANGTRDLDNVMPLENNRFYHFAVVYSGTTLELYQDGVLNAFSEHSGLISTTAKAVTFGRKDDAEAQYYLRGVLDEVRIYDRAVYPSEIEALKNQWSVITDAEKPISSWRAYPNPSTDHFYIRNISESSVSSITLVDMKGVPVSFSTKMEGSLLKIEPDQPIPGMYVLSFLHQGKRYHLKLIMQ